VKATKSLNFTTLYRQYGCFIEVTLDVAKKEDEMKTKLKKRCTNSKYKKKILPIEITINSIKCPWIIPCKSYFP